MHAGLSNVRPCAGLSTSSLYNRRALPRFAVTVVVLALIAGAAVAFAATERLKLELSPVTGPRFDRRFSPVCECNTAKADLSVRFRRRETVDATIVDDRGKEVRVLATNEPVARGRHRFVWDGRDEVGGIAPDGVYRLRLRLDRSGRTILVPTTIRLDTTAPEVILVRVRPDAFSSSGGSAKRYAKVVYRSNEKGEPEILVDGQGAVVGKIRAKGRASINWKGTVDGKLVKPGTYDVGIRVTDLAGNVSEPTRTAAVDVKP